MNISEPASPAPMERRLEPGSRGNPALLSLLAAAALFLCFWGINWGMPNQRSSAVDNLILDGIWAHRGRDLSAENIDIYPPLCYIQMEAIFAILRPIVRRSTFGWAPAETASIYIVAARAISAVLTGATAVIVCAISARLFGREAGPLAGALYIFNPTPVYYAHTSNCEATYVFYFALAAWFFVRWRQQNGRPALLVAFFLSAAAATAAKDQAAFVLAGPALLSFVRRPKSALAAAGISAVLFAVIYVAWGGPGHFGRHVSSMNANAVQFFSFSTSPSDLTRLALLFVKNSAQVLGPVLPLAVPALAKMRGNATASSWAAFCLAAILPYLAAILLLAHRMNPRFSLPLLPLGAVLAGGTLSMLSAGRKGRAAVWILLLALFFWGGGIVEHLRSSPVDLSKKMLRQALASGQIPRGSQICLFTRATGRAYRKGPDNTWKEVPVVRDWTKEAYGWVADDIRVTGLLPQQERELSRLAPEFVILFDDDPVARPPQGYREVERFEPRFPWLYGFIYRPRGLALYARAAGPPG